jgi:hypothetical protein
VILNSFEFWTGTNPFKVSESEDGKTKVVQAGDTTAIVAYSDEGRSAHVSYARAGHIIGSA